MTRLCKDAPVELLQVVERFVEGLKFVDASSESAARTMSGAASVVTCLTVVDGL